MGVEAGLLLLGFVIASSGLAAAITVTGRSTTSISTEAVKERVTEILPVIKVRGTIIGSRGGDGETVPFYVESIRVPLTTYGATPVPLDPTSMTITYYDREWIVPDIPWSVQWIRQYDGDGNGIKDVLIPGDVVEISLYVSTLSPRVAESGAITLQFRPAQGAVTTVSRTIPELSQLNCWQDRDGGV